MASGETGASLEPPGETNWQYLPPHPVRQPQQDVQ